MSNRGVDPKDITRQMDRVLTNYSTTRGKYSKSSGGVPQSSSTKNSENKSSYDEYRKSMGLSVKPASK